MWRWRTVSASLLLAALAATAWAQEDGANLPVGYDRPGAYQGGPSLAGGLRWIQGVWPRTITFAEQFAGGTPTVMFMTNYGGVDTVQELARRFPMDVVHLYPSSNNKFTSREHFDQLLRSRERIDCFVLSRFHHGTIPADVQYEMLRRVRDGAGLVVVDCYDQSPTLTPRFLELEAAEQGARLIQGIPYAGLRKWENTERREYVTFNYWNTGGHLDFEPGERPYQYDSVTVYPFGEGRIVWVNTGTHWARARRSGRTLLPHIQQNRSMYVETDYYYSHTAKVILKAIGYAPAVCIAREEGEIEFGSARLANMTNAPFEGRLRYQVRDTWGIVTASGEEALTVAAGASMGLPDAIQVTDAGRQFVDLWVLDGDGRVVDWGSAFADVDRGVPAPEIAPDHPEGTPRGEPLRATIGAQGAPAGAVVRATLVDRYWREVGRLEQAAGVAVTCEFGADGLDGQIWTLKADVMAADGSILARSWANLTSPHTRATRGGFHPLMTCAGMACPEEAGRREYLRRLGFLANRPYSPGNRLMAEAHAWNDIQMHTFPFNLRGATNDYKSDHINDWEEPRVRADVEEALRLVTEEFKPYGHRGFNFTDDSPPAKELPAGAYTTAKFHEWLKREYGDIAAVGRAWGMNQRSFHSFGRVHREMVRAEYEAGNTAPWIDAQRFLQELWVQRLAQLRDVVREVNPEVIVGSDAGYYGSARSPMFGRLDYLAPYYRDGRGTKIAVARGRMRRPGDYGACLGSYGDKPAEMSGRRGQIWDVLFAGGTGFYYWTMGVGMSEGMELSDKHALYQCEVIEEITSGIGELFTGAERIFDPIAILDSQTSGICDQLEKEGEPVTIQENSLAAAQWVLEDLGLNSWTITTPELVAGWLADAGIRALLLPGVTCLSDTEAEAIRAFVEGRGTVIADVLPGRRLPNGNLRKAPPLLDVFGVGFDAKAEVTRARGTLAGSAADGGPMLDFGPALADPRVTADSATALGELTPEEGEKVAALFVNEAGSGRALCLNASFSSYVTYRSETGELWRAWPEVVREAMRAAGVEPAFTYEAGGEMRGMEISPFRNGAGYLVGMADLGFGTSEGGRRSFRVTCPARMHIHEGRSGRYLGESETIEDEIPDRGHRAYVLLPYRVRAVSLSADTATVQPGGTITLTADVATEPGGRSALHVLRIEARAPDGESFFPFRRVLRMAEDGALRVPLTTALNDAVGEWTFTATDIGSGLSATATVTLGGGGA